MATFIATLIQNESEVWDCTREIKGVALDNAARLFAQELKARHLVMIRPYFWQMKMDAFGWIKFSVRTIPNWKSSKKVSQRGKYGSR